MRRVFGLMLTMGGLLFLVAACGLDETYTGLGEGALPGDPLYPASEEPVACECNCVGGGGASTDVVPQGNDVTVADLTGRGYRIDDLVITGPFEGMVADTLNNYFAEQIEADGLNVLFLVTEDDREAGTVTFRLGAGEAGDGHYSFLDQGAGAPCTLSGDLFTSFEPTLLVIPNEALAPPTLPVNELSLQGTFDVEGTTISEGVLEGALTEADAETIKILAVPLADFLSDSELEKDLDLDDDGTFDAWRFTFTYAAVEVAVQED